MPEHVLRNSDTLDSELDEEARGMFRATAHPVLTGTSAAVVTVIAISVVVAGAVAG
ncbi:MULTISPECIES: hypothetical protein [unclassified Streptomyces]|uniref:hypothetical protein n=1 Tax=unclassified Streptomyces TaxID=2593676 RepID=UPI001906740B|nr:hypothetical protein [Streptomyces sp. HSG2]